MRYLLDMAPTSTVNYLANVSALQPQVASYGLSSFTVSGALAYFANKVIGHSGRIVGFAFHQTSARNGTRKMRPAFSANYVQNISTRASKIIRYRLLSFTFGRSLANFYNHVIRQLRAVVVGSLALAVFLLVSDIRLLGIPSQVFNAIIASVAIVVTSLHSWRARANKGFENKAVDGFVVHLSVSPNDDNKEATVLVVYPGAHLNPSITDAPMSSSLKTRKDCTIGSGAVVRIFGNWLAVIGERWCVHGYYSITHGPMVQI